MYRHTVWAVNSVEYLSRFFFSSRRRHTRCLSDWSSDVCSSDLDSLDVRGEGRHVRIGEYGSAHQTVKCRVEGGEIRLVSSPVVRKQIVQAPHSQRSHGSLHGMHLKSVLSLNDGHHVAARVAAIPCKHIRFGVY